MAKPTSLPCLLTTTVLLLSLLVATTSALRFYLPSNEKRCLKEEIHKSVILTGEYEFSDALQHTSSVHVSGWVGVVGLI